MRDLPSGDQLLETALHLLRNEIIPSLSSEHRHSALMVANAMSIAMRQLKNGDEHLREELVALRELLGADARADDKTALMECNRRLCQWIRSGMLDSGKARDDVWTLLVRMTRQRVAESNPRYLDNFRG